MNRRSFLIAAASVGVPGLAAEAALSAQATRDPVRSSNTVAARQIERAAKAAFALQRRDWEQGILAQAMLQSGQHERLIQLTRAAMLQQTPDGRMGVVVNGGVTDPAMGGEAYARAADLADDPAMHDAVQRMLEWILHKAPRNAGGVLYHTFDAPQMWSDGVNGAPPFLVAMGNFDEAMFQIEGYRQRLFNSEKGLMAHIWDDGQQRFVDPNFWGGGNGWTAAGLARVIRILPQSRQQDRDNLARFARRLIDGCIAYQRSDGLFHDVVDQPNTFVETNLAQMLAFSIYQGSTDGWLPSSYLPFAHRMRRAARGKMDPLGFVQGACSAPNFDRPGISTEAQAFCILMEAAGQQWA
jgi:rhamnogalacturonyl hydrolase YesR